jgi:hypothetical protein
MSSHPLDSTGGWAANAVLIGVAAVPLVGAWVFSLGSVPPHSAQLRFGYRFLRPAAPILLLYVGAPHRPALP